MNDPKDPDIAEIRVTPFAEEVVFLEALVKLNLNTGAMDHLLPSVKLYPMIKPEKPLDPKLNWTKLNKGRWK